VFCRATGQKEDASFSGPIVWRCPCSHIYIISKSFGWRRRLCGGIMKAARHVDTWCELRWICNRPRSLVGKRHLFVPLSALGRARASPRSRSKFYSAMPFHKSSVETTVWCLKDALTKITMYNFGARNLKHARCRGYCARSQIFSRVSAKKLGRRPLPAHLEFPLRSGSSFQFTRFYSPAWAKWLDPGVFQASFFPKTFYGADFK
jgi:hypothetical protein